MKRYKTLEEILSFEGNEIALVIGNGVNLTKNHKNGSWMALLSQLADETLDTPISKETLDTLSLTEFYDLLGIKDANSRPPGYFQKRFCDLMKSWVPNNNHKMIVDWAQEFDRPLLTTNFDHCFSEVANLELFRKSKSPKGFTDFYPWDSFFANKHPSKESEPHQHFGVWHINGLKYYKRSIRLGLSHYMGSVERARQWLHKGDQSLFKKDNQSSWIGANSWLHIFFNSPLLIFGLMLNENEVFFRWMLIERAIYFKKYPNLAKPSWYIAPKSDISEAKRYFLEGVNVECIAVDDFDDIYSRNIWTQSQPR